MKSKPPITLCDLLGLNMDESRGLCMIGRLPQNEVTFLQDGSSAHPFNGDHCGHVGHEDEFQPVPASERNCYFFDFGEVDPRDTDDLITPALLALLPKLGSVPDLRFTYLKCDSLPLHDDLAMKRHDHLYSMAILLAAPHGCRLVTGGEHQTILEPGDVVVINDQLKHGAYPINKPSSTAEINLASIPVADQEQFVDRNCLSFLLICAVDSR